MTRGRELLVGAVILVALAVGVAGTLWLQGTSWGRPAYPVEVLLRDVAQLSEGNAVKFRGVRIGQVARIRVESSGQAVRVFLELDGDVTLPDDAVALVAPESFFGSWQAEITNRGRYTRFDFFEVPPAEAARDTLVLGGYALPELSRLTASAEQISDNLADLTDRFDIAFNEETAANLARAIANVESVTSDLKSFVDRETESVGRISSAADSALREIQEASRAARLTFERIEGFLGDTRMDSIVSNVRATTGSLRIITSDLSGTTDELAETLARAESAFTRLDRITERVAAGEGAFGRLLNDSTFAVRAESALEELTLLLADIRENPRRYVRLSIF